MQSDRDPLDPLVNPRPGDVVEQDGLRREVTRLLPSPRHCVVKWRRPGSTVEAHGIWLPYWRQWAKNGKVIHAAD